jgi:hypothetical protein
MPDEHFPRETCLCQTSACDIAARDMKYLAHFFPAERFTSPAEKSRARNEWRFLLPERM